MGKIVQKILIKILSVSRIFGAPWIDDVEINLKPAALISDHLVSETVCLLAAFNFNDSFIKVGRIIFSGVLKTTCFKKIDCRYLVRKL